MAVVLVSGIKRYEGTAAEIAAFSLAGIPAGSTFFESDTGIIKVLDQAGVLKPKYEQVKIAAGMAIVGKVGIDQTTPGTTNAVALTGRTTIKTATIANGGSLSGEVDIEDYQFVAIMMPADWTPANLTFQASNVSGGTFVDVYNDAGDEITALAAATRIITIDVNSLGLAPLSYIKIRSGTSATAVVQGAERTLTLILKK